MFHQTKLDCIIAIHNTILGPALGGVRSWEYNSFEDQKRDALRLSEAMTLKNSICGINFGGGKAALNLKNVKKRFTFYRGTLINRVPSCKKPGRFILDRNTLI